VSPCTSSSPQDQPTAQHAIAIENIPRELRTGRVLSGLTARDVSDVAGLEFFCCLTALAAMISLSRMAWLHRYPTWLM
jgi:hypothetical protein